MWMCVPFWQCGRVFPLIGQKCGDWCEQQKCPPKQATFMLKLFWEVFSRFWAFILTWTLQRVSDALHFVGKPSTPTVLQVISGHALLRNTRSFPHSSGGSLLVQFCATPLQLWLQFVFCFLCCHLWCHHCHFRPLTFWMLAEKSSIFVRNFHFRHHFCSSFPYLMISFFPFPTRWNKLAEWDKAMQQKFHGWSS